MLTDADGDRPGEPDFDAGKGVRVTLLDEDANGQPDLGETWSAPALGRIRIGDSAGQPLDRYVAVFGGGMPPNHSLRAPDAGHWLYMVDVETGRALYKRRLVDPATGADTAMAADAAAVDTDQDGYLDRIYLATLGGVVFRVDLGPGPDGRYPPLETVGVRGDDGMTYEDERVVHAFGGTQLAWQPYAIFDAGSGAAGHPPRPLYYRPTVLFVARQGRYALAFGGGDRHNLWSRDLEDPAADPPVERPGRFYLFVDDSGGPGDPALPYSERNFTRIERTAADLAGSTDLLAGAPGHRGWYLALEGEERLTSAAFALSGITEFTTYTPVHGGLGQSCAGTGGAAGGGQPEPLCGRQGSSKIYAVQTTNANSVLVDPGTREATRALDLGDAFAAEAFVEPGLNKNPRGGEPAAGQLRPEHRAVMEKLKRLFPSSCRFANHRLDIKTMTAETGVILVAPVPVCIVEKNWKEF